MKTIEEMIEVMEHHKNGGEVEFSQGNNSWNNVKEPQWNWSSHDYRINKQKKTVTIEKWLCEYNRCEELTGSQRFFILEKAVPFEFGNGKKVKRLDTYEVEL